MNRKEITILLATLCVITFLFIIVNSQKQTKSAKKANKNGIDLKQIQNRGVGRRVKNNGNRNKVINNNKINVGKNNGKNKGKINNRNNGKNNNKTNGNNGNVEIDTGFLSLKNQNFVYKSKKVFLSGVNIYYLNTTGQFGHGNYAEVKPQYERYLKFISDSGGNAVRVVLNSNTNVMPKLGTDGYATGEDTDSIIQELGQFLDTAQSYNIFVFIAIWNGLVFNYRVAILTDDAKLDRYIEKVLKPVVSGLSTKKALGAWEVILSPQESVLNNISDSDPCFDTRNLFHQYASHNINKVSMKDMLKFINRHLDAIKIADSKALRSVVSKEEEASEYCDWCYNYWQNKCLIAAGGKANGILDYYSFDAVAFIGYDYYWSPLRKKPEDYRLGKPIIIAMSSGNCSDSKSGVTNFNNAYLSRYAGIFSWRYQNYYAEKSTSKCYDSEAQCNASMEAIRNYDMIQVSIY